MQLGDKLTYLNLKEEEEKNCNEKLDKEVYKNE